MTTRKSSYGWVEFASPRGIYALSKRAVQSLQNYKKQQRREQCVAISTPKEDTTCYWSGSEEKEEEEESGDQHTKHKQQTHIPAEVKVYAC
eukprot:scaffold5540_cov96-Cylindrotheca_fusiformis.AAC.13